MGLVVLCALAGYVLGMIAGVFRKKSARRDAGSILTDANDEADRIKKHADLAVKAEQLSLRETFEKETQEVRQELRQHERRLSKREDDLDKKADLIGKKEKYIDNTERELSVRQKHLAGKELELEKLLQEEKEQLHRVSGLSHEEAGQLLMKRIEDEMQHECDALVNKLVERAKESADRKAREIVATAVQRCAVDHSSDMVVSTIDLPNDDMKGRIIGREGRNIRAFEKATGIDVIVDDTPSVIVVSGFDSVRRETARRAMEKLIQDGRIHPARIEEIVAKARKEIDGIIEETGKQTTLDVDVPGLPPKIVNLLGRLRYRTSYGQNVLNHSTEVAFLMGTMAAELGLDIRLAKRIGLLHDIGKAMDHEVEGGHAEIGADLARKLGEKPEIVNAILAHHEAAQPETLYAVLVQVADALSASRPGARRESLEKYIKRLERLEEVAKSFGGVENAFAIQAGREVRVIVKPDRVTDKNMSRLARDIATEIEQELTYPGQITVTVLRETRAVEYAR
ncbi:MAG: ribonuclease Y [Planctomycetes bacterium]|nr:ribonuclease Y [Planctomycetota bacterium]